jgi:hypothetical protein
MHSSNRQRREDPRHWRRRGIDRASNQAKPRREHAKYLDTRSGRLRLAMILDNSAGSIAAS